MNFFPLSFNYSQQFCWEYYSRLTIIVFSSWSALFQNLLIFKGSIEESAIVWVGFPLHMTCAFLLQLSMHCLCYVYLDFNNDMPWRFSFLVLSFWCSMCFLYVYGCVFLSFSKFSFMILLKFCSIAIELVFISLIYSFNLKVNFVVSHISHTFIFCAFNFFYIHC